MMPFDVDCPSCGTAKRIDGVGTSGNRIRCAGCGQPVVAEEPLPPDEMRYPVCGARMRAVAHKCEPCGEVFYQSLAERKRVDAEKQRVWQEKQDRNTAITIFVSALLGCFPPLVAVYGIVFLIRRPQPFPYKQLAVIGTVMHWVWTTSALVWFWLKVVLSTES